MFSNKETYSYQKLEDEQQEVQDYNHTIENREAKKEDHQQQSGDKILDWNQEAESGNKDIDGRMNKSDSMENLIQSDEEDDDDEDDGIRGYFHPKLRKHWRTITVAGLLLLFGIAFLVCGILILIAAKTKYTNGEGPNGYIFFVCAGICLVPGVYHVVYIVRAVKGHKGYKMDDVTLFHE